MPAPKGNQFAIGNSGRSKKWKSAKDLQRDIDAYFAECDPPYSMKALAKFLNVSRETLYNYRKYNAFGSVFEIINERIVVKQRTLNIKYHNKTQYCRDKYRKDPYTKIVTHMGNHMRYALKNKETGAFRHLPYTVSDLKQHLESQFKKGMTWENFGQWHIDHILPVSRFTFKSVKDPEFISAYALNNLQPLWAVDNLRKGNRLGNKRQINIPL